MLSSSNLLYRYRKFVVSVNHYPQFKVNLVYVKSVQIGVISGPYLDTFHAVLVRYFFETELTHLKQICNNVFAMLIYWTNHLVSKYRQKINLLP